MKLVDREDYSIFQIADEDWPESYAKLLGHPLSDSLRFFRSIEIYGYWHVYEAVISTATRNLKTDPLGYVLSVAHSNWRKARREEEESAKYEMRLEIAKERSRENSKTLNDKIEKAKQRRAHGSNNTSSGRI